MTLFMIAGGLVGLGLYLFVRALVPGRPGVAVQLGRLDAARTTRVLAAKSAASASLTEQFDGRFGQRIQELFAARGINFTRQRQDLAMMDRPLHTFLANKVLTAVVAFVALVLLGALISLAGLHLGVTLPFWLGLAGLGVGFILPDVQLRQEAAARRNDFRHVVGAFLDLVAMNLSGGRGVPEALLSASSISDHWVLIRLRDALELARLAGKTPWSALGELGEEIGLDELRDLAAALALVAEDGAKVRESLTARAESLRRKELASQQGKAAERSQSMLVAQLLLCVGFLLFLVYPAAIRILNS